MPTSRIILTSLVVALIFTSVANWLPLNHSGFQASAEKDPKRHLGASGGGSAALSVNSVDSNGNAITGYWTVVSQGSSTVQTGFTPLSTTLTSGTYSVSVSDYGSFAFSHWSDGTITRVHSVTISSSAVSLTAVYSGSSGGGRGGSILVFPESVRDGDIVQVFGSNFAPSAMVQLYFDTTILTGSIADYSGLTSTPRSISTNAEGRFVATFEVPWSVAGPHVVKVTDSSNAATSQIIVQPSMILGPTSAYSGSTVAIRGNGYAPSSAIKLTFDGNLVATSATNLTGVFSAAFAIPKSASVGPHDVRAEDSKSDSSSAQFAVLSSTTKTFRFHTIVNGLKQLDGFAFIPDKGPNTDGSGSFIAIEKNGRAVIVKNLGGTFVIQSKPFVTVPSVSKFPETGLLGIAIDPNWENSKMVYFYHTANITGKLENEVVRYVATTDSYGNIVADAKVGKTIILGGIPAGHVHNGGHMKFDSSGDLYVTTGDNFLFTPSQDLTSLAGKILKIKPLASASGGKMYSIPTGNMFAALQEPGIRKEIFSYGVRNSVGIDIDSQSGRIYMNQVGHHTWESIFDTTNPANLGWPDYEGPVIGNPHNLANYREPIYWYPHAGFCQTSGPSANIAAITGAAFYHGTYYPSQFNGAYFFGDYGVGFISALLPPSQYQPRIDTVTFVPKAQVETVLDSGLLFAPIDIQEWNGRLYFISFHGSVDVLTYN